MQLLRLAYRNFLRNKRRSIISGVSIALAIAAIIFAQSWLRGVTRNISDNVIRLITGHVRITTREYDRRERMLPLSESIELTPKFYEDITTEEVMVVTPRIKFGVLLGQEELSIPALGYAIDPAKEIEIVGLNKRIVEGEYLDSFSNCAILGSELRKRLGVEVGDTMTIITRTAYDAPTGINLRIVGTFSLGIGGMDRNIFYMPLRVGQKVLDLEGRATEIVVILKDQNKSIEYARNLTLGDNYSVVPFQYNPIVSYMSIIGRIYSIIYAIILLVACSTIANTMMMVVFERRREIGMIKALGLTNGSIVGLLVIEAALIGLVGSTIGALIGGITSYWLKYHGVNIAEMSSAATASMPFGPIIYLLPTPLTVGGAFLFGLLATIIVALFPISRVTKLEPAKALRSI